MGNEGELKITRRMVPDFSPEPHYDFDHNWAGPLELRPAVYRTQSEKDTWMAVGVENEYGLSDLTPDDVVIDIGAHIGAFSHLAYRKGSRSVYAFEIDPWHIEAAVRNLMEMQDGVLLHHAAVVRSDEHRAPQYYYNGSWNSFGVVGQQVDSISLDEILAPHESVRFLKIDCEGGEWPILYTCSQIHKIQEIAGEYHVSIDKNARETSNLPYEISVNGLRNFLEDNGFAVSIYERETLGNFYATRVPQLGAVPFYPNVPTEPNAIFHFGEDGKPKKPDPVRPSKRLRDMADYLESQGL